LTLLMIEDVVAGAVDGVGGPEVAGAAVLRPDGVVRGAEALLAQTAGTPCFELGHRGLGGGRGGDDGVNVVRADVQRVKGPATDVAVPTDRVFDQAAFGVAENVRASHEESGFTVFAVVVGGEVGRGGLVVKGVDAAAGIAMEPCALAGPGEEVRERDPHAGSLSEPPREQGGGGGRAFQNNGDSVRLGV
jgi:hypothetical protein